MLLQKSILPIAVLFIALMSGCVEETKIAILDPPRGAMVAAGQDLTVQVKFEGSSATVNGETLSGGGTHSVTLPEVDGLGFVTAMLPGDPLFDVRSYHQGVYRAPTDWHSSTIGITVGAEPLDTGTVSISGLVADLLTDEDLEPYVNDPFTILSLSVNVTSVTSPDVSVTMSFVGADLTFEATLYDVLILYSAGGLISGTVTYDYITVSGGVSLTPSAVTLTDVVSDYDPDPVITVGGMAPSGFEGLLQSALDGELPAAVESAAQNAAEAVFPVLVQNLRPTVGVDFDQPISQETSPEDLTVEAGAIQLGYETLMTAVSPVLADAGHQVLERLATDGPDSGDGLTVVVGSALVNQMAFAVWDAGNLDGLVLTEAELVSLGMPALDFPYDKLNEVEIDLLLPPLLEWGTDGPYLDVGGIQIRIDVASIPDSTAWTAAQVPVQLVQEGNALRLVVDPARSVVVRDVGFDRMSDLADQDKVMSLMEHAVPGVVDRVFGDLPMIRLESVQLARLDGSAGPTIQPELLSVTERTDTWLLDVELTIP